MPRVLAWVIGQGLLGSSLVRSLPVAMRSATLWDNPVGAFRWMEQSALRRQMAQAVATFAATAREQYDRWLVFWAAGSSVVGTGRDLLSAELETWQLFLDLVQKHLLDQARPIPGQIFLASSAGGVFGNGAAPILTEESPCRPLSEYGRSKLLHEEVLFHWVGQNDGVRSLIGRISNLYGPGQKLNKGQGLISHLCRCAIHQRPAHIYVPLDTSRDYIYVDDAADIILRCMDRLCASDESKVLKLCASERTTSVAQIVGAISRMGRRNLRVICSPNPLRLQQPKRLQFRSTVWSDIRALPSTPLSIGISRVYQYQFAQYRRGKLPQPV